jgi:hypothetical protein
LFEDVHQVGENDGQITMIYLHDILVTGLKSNALTWQGTALLASLVNPTIGD